MVSGLTAIAGPGWAAGSRTRKSDGTLACGVAAGSGRSKHLDEFLTAIPGWQTSPSGAHLSASEIIDLHNAGVSQKVIDFMINRWPEVPQFR